MNKKKLMIGYIRSTYQLIPIYVNKYAEYSYTDEIKHIQIYKYVKARRILIVIVHSKFGLYRANSTHRQ